MEPTCKDLEQRIELYLDGARIELPPIESIVLLNIPSWGAGVDLWKLGQGTLFVWLPSLILSKNLFLYID